MTKIVHEYNFVVLYIVTYTYNIGAKNMLFNVVQL